MSYDPYDIYDYQYEFYDYNYEFDKHLIDKHLGDCCPNSQKAPKSDFSLDDVKKS